MNSRRYQTLCKLLQARSGTLVIALSGGIDSLTLMTVAARVRKPLTTIAVHAVSAAVPAEATQRCRLVAAQRDWQLQEIDALEMHNSDYVSNPVNRCYFCKSNLFEGIQKLREVAGTRVIATGTNQDDLGDYRPGLIAAGERDVWQPFVEAGIDKKNIRSIARYEGLGNLAELPAQPCLASRVETGIAINASDLGLIYRVEKAITSISAAGDIRCRIRPDGVIVQLPADNEILTCSRKQQLARGIVEKLCAPARKVFMGFEPYRMGSSFLTDSVADNAGR